MTRRIVLAGFILLCCLSHDRVGAQVGPSVAILDSANTSIYFGLHYPACDPPDSVYLGADEYQRYFRGWELVLQANDISYAIIQDEDIEGGALDQFDGPEQQHEGAGQ